MIREVIVTTIDRAGQAHIAPLGYYRGGGRLDHRAVSALRNARQSSGSPVAVANYVDDARIFAGLVTGRRDWPLIPATKCPPRLAGALSHAELKVAHVEADAERPRFHCRLCIRSSMRHSKESTAPPTPWSNAPS